HGAMRLGGGALEGWRSAAARDVRTADAAYRQKACDRGRDSSTCPALSSSLVGVGGSSNCSVGHKLLRPTDRSRLLFPDTECLRPAAWSGLKSRTLCSFAALGPNGHGALSPRATNDILVTVPCGTRTNNRLASTAFAPARTEPTLQGGGNPRVGVWTTPAITAAGFSPPWRRHASPLSQNRRRTHRASAAYSLHG